MRPLCLAMLACCLLPLMSPAAVAADDSPPVDQPKPATAAVGDGTGAAARRRQPNVVVILADDAGWGDFSVTGNQTLATPAVDSLAADGCLLETFFVQPVCAPTRAELLTGRWHPRGGVRGVTEGAERLSPDERTIAEVFRDGGYATGCFGKWHNGTQWPYHPLARGFERFYGFTEGHTRR
jgi:arylsulfatase A-like enzyme